MARPRLKIDAVEVEKLAMIQCTAKEIGDFVGCSGDTIERRFADVLIKGRTMGKMSLRRAMYKKAIDGGGNCTMMIWLSKQYLGMTDKIEQDTINVHQIEEIKQLEALTKEELKKLAKEEIEK